MEIKNKASAWDTVRWNTSYINKPGPDEVLIFNKPCKRELWEKCKKPKFINFKLFEWVDYLDMTQEELEIKGEYVSEVLGGFYKDYEYKEAFKRSWE